MSTNGLAADAVAKICEHMNDDHADAVADYARRFGGLAGVRSARLAAIDCEGMDLDVELDTGNVPARIAFDHVLADANDARDTLIAMARGADPG